MQPKSWAIVDTLLRVRWGQRYAAVAALGGVLSLLMIGHVVLSRADARVAATPLRASIVEPSALAAPSEAAILTIDGLVRNTNGDGAARLDRRQIEALGLRALATSNPFAAGVQRYEGVLLSDLLALVGAEGSTILARALDGYTVEIPLQDARDYPIMLALKWNGDYMQVRNKGPLWLVYPVDQFEELDSEIYSARSIWQLTQITVR